MGKPFFTNRVLLIVGIIFSGIGAPLASSYAYNGLGLRTGLVGAPLGGHLGVAPYGAHYGTGLATNYGYGLTSPLGLRSAVSPLGYGAHLPVRSAVSYGLNTPLGLGYGAGYGVGVGAYGLGGPLLH